MKKNSQIHIYLESELKEKLIEQAKKENISLCELCRQKIKEDSRLEKIEMMLGVLTRK